MDRGPLLLCGLSAETVRALTEAGHPVERAFDGYRALELAERIHPEAVVLPVELPGPGPVELLALHSGILWAEPLPGGGSRVSFTIPAHGPAGPPERDASATASASS